MENSNRNEKAKLTEFDLVKLFDGTAQEIANSFINKEPDKGNPYSVSHSQMRRLYNEVKRIDQKLDGDPEKWKKYYPNVVLIKSKTSYNVARAIEKKPHEGDVYRELSSFMMNYIDKVKDEKDYHIFSALFEAVYGFYYKETVKNKIKGE